MIVGLRGAGTTNKGAELMLVALMQHFSGKDVEFAVGTSALNHTERCKYALHPIVSARRWGRSKLATLFMTRSFRDSCGIVSPLDLDAVLDGSGFAYGDHLGEQVTVAFANEAKRLKRQGKKVVLLPQAFGPFSTDKIRSGVKRLVEHVDLLFARDRFSYHHVVDLAGQDRRIQLAPDFTVLTNGNTLGGLPQYGHFALVVPNARMLNRTDAAVASWYVPFLSNCVKWLHAHEVKPIVLLHDTALDRDLATEIRESSGEELEVIEEPDPLVLKHILSRAQLVIGSRYHAIIGALSQGVPCIGTGWSHKYEALFEDYGCKEMLVNTDTSEEQLYDLLRRVFDSARERLVSRIGDAAKLHKAAARRMWDEVDELLLVQ